METIFINKENIKTNEQHKFALNLSQRLHFRSSDNHVALHDLCICYMWENIRKQYKNNKPKMIDPSSTINLSYQMALILFQIFKIVSNLLLKNMKHEQQFLLFFFTLIQLIRIEHRLK